MKRKLLCLLLAMCMLLSLGAAPASAAAPRRHSITVTAVPMAEEGITWAVDDGLLTISGMGAVPDYAQGEAPWLEEEIYSIIIEDGITHLGSNAFRGMEKVQDVTIGRGVTGMGERVFNDCPVLRRVLFLGNSHRIPAGTFANSPMLTSFTFGGDQPLLEAGSLVTGAESVTARYDSSNETWSDKKNVQFDPVDPVEYYAYLNHPGESGTCGDNLTWQVVLSDLYYLSNYLVITGTGAMYDYSEDEAPWLAYLKRNSITVSGLYLSAGITYIGENAFDGLRLSTVSLPGSVREIGAGAFRNNTNLSSAILRENIRIVGDEAFANCDLRSLSISSQIEFGTGVYRDCSNLPSATLPEGMTRIPDQMFSGCSKLRRVTIPTTMTSIGTEAFSGCNWLKTVRFYGTTTQWDAIEIGAGNEKLLEAELEGVLTTSGTCGENAVWELSEDFTTLTISGTGAVTSHPWDNAAALVQTVIVGDGITALCDSALYGFNAVTEIRLPQTLTEIGASCFHGNSALTHLELPAGLTKLGEGTFSSCANLEFMAIPEGITEIPDELFSWCGKLVSVELHDGITAIGSGAFQMCRSLSEIDIPAGLTKLGGDAFLDCDSLTEFVWPEAITFVGTALRSSGIRELVLPETVTHIGMYAFDGCTNLEKITIPDSVTSFDEYAFRSTTSLSEIHIPQGITVIPFSCFNNSGLREVILPEGVTTIERYAFQSCDELERVVLPESLTSISDEVFTYCSSLQEINWPSGVKNIGWHQFRGTALAEFTVPATVELVESYAFMDCTKLEKLTFEGRDTVLHGSQIFDNTPNLTIWCWYGSSAQSQAEFELIPYILFDPPADLPKYPVFTYVLGNGTLTADPAESTGYEWITIEATPDEGHYLAALEVYYYAEEEIQIRAEQLSETTFRLLMPKCPIEIAALFQDERMVFVDVLPNQFFYDSVLWALENNITSGTDATHFSPAAPCNRAQVVTFLWNAADCPEPQSTVNPFVDVPAGAWFEKPVLWAVENGITSGTDETHFSPAAPCNRATVVTFLWHAAGDPPAAADSPFTDVPAGSWYDAPVRWALENGITSGISPTEFGAAAICNRAQVVTFLYKAFGE